MSKPRSRFSQFSTSRLFGLVVIFIVSALLWLCMFSLFLFASSVYVFVFVINLYPLNCILIVSQNLLFRLKQEEKECDKDSLSLWRLSPLEQKELLSAPSLSGLPLIQSLEHSIVTIIKRKFHIFVLLSVCLICFCFSHVQIFRLSTESKGLSMVFQRESLRLIRLSLFCLQQPTHNHTARHRLRALPFPGSHQL